MEFAGHLLLAAFIALILFTAVTFGFMLLVWFIVFAIFMTIVFMLRSWIRRMWFLYCTRDSQYTKKSPKVIETQYRDISDEK